MQDARSKIIHALPWNLGSRSGKSLEPRPEKQGFLGGGPERVRSSGEGEAPMRFVIGFVY